MHLDKEKVVMTIKNLVFGITSKDKVVKLPKKLLFDKFRKGGVK